MRIIGLIIRELFASQWTVQSAMFPLTIETTDVLNICNHIQIDKGILLGSIYTQPKKNQQDFLLARINVVSSTT